MSAAATDAGPRIDASQGDPECLIGMSSARRTRPSGALWLGVAIVLTSAAWLVISLFPESRVNQVLTRSWTNFASIGFAIWCMLILLVKLIKIRIQRRALHVSGIFPSRSDWVLSPGTAPEVLQRIRARVDRPREFLVFNRVWVALSNLGNIGEARDVDEILRSQAAQDESTVETSYSVVQGFVWAIPVLGFIGTVLGLSEAIGQFSGVLGAGSDVEQISGALKGVTAGLATAFETTLEALVAALVIQLLITMLRKSEEEFLDEAMDYGLRYVVGRLRILPENQAE